ncbi:hypothetical protein [Mesorhizobium sp. B1-1-8]|uniref:hypothetical protein n=1 Tax=Mesorhizobium sp. B1-1-8 TaxID=2589976 RepID=UPI00112CA947|nr:hypothetical protein [Mesorhizobium sp. B1-1-8]UCI10353.1 hypothetical protein FJ974_28895 [Mesorhizobium sp. B1-1-8]
MSKFKEALERGKQAHRRQEDHAPDDEADEDAPVPDFGTQATAWLNDVVVASLEAAKAEVASEVTINIVTMPRGEFEALTPSLRFQIYKDRGLEQEAERTFTVSTQVSGEVSVSAPGMVAEEVGNIGDKSDERFRNLVVRLIEDAAKA